MFSFSLANGNVRSLLLTVIGMSLLATAAVPVVGAEETFDPRTIREATTAFQDVTKAEAAGYALLPDKDVITCIDNPEEGTMGIHYANGELVAAGAVDPGKPQVFVYEPGDNDELQLVGVEYVVFQEG